MDDRGTAAALPEQETAPERRARGFILAEHEPLPEGVEAGDEGVFVIRMIAVAPKRVEAANAAD